MECEFCKNVFKSVFNLSNHQSKAKYCLRMRNKDEPIMNRSFTCEFCGLTKPTKISMDLHKGKCKLNIPIMIVKNNQINSLTELKTKHEIMITERDKRISVLQTQYDMIVLEHDRQLIQLKDDYSVELKAHYQAHYQAQNDEKLAVKDRHIRTIRQKYKNIIKSNEKQYDELQIQLDIYKNLADRTQDTLSEIAKQPRNNTNNTSNNQTNILMSMTPLDINEELFGEKITEYFTSDYLVSGQKGVAQFCVDHLLKDDNGKLTYICTDPSRNTFRYRTVHGVLERDVNAKKLTDALSQNLRKHAANEMVKIGYSGDNAKITAYTPGSMCITALLDNNTEFCSGLKSIVTS